MNELLTDLQNFIWVVSFYTGAAVVIYVGVFLALSLCDAIVRRVRRFYEGGRV